jgi:hypothetical protein
MQCRSSRFVTIAACNAFERHRLPHLSIPFTLSRGVVQTHSRPPVTGLKEKKKTSKPPRLSPQGISVSKNLKHRLQLFLLFTVLLLLVKRFPLEFVTSLAKVRCKLPLLCSALSLFSMHAVVHLYRLAFMNKSTVTPLFHLFVIPLIRWVDLICL